jgi:hypothetical protein
LDDLDDLDDDPNEGRSNMEQWFPEDGSNDQDCIIGVVMPMIDLDLCFIVGVL